MSSKFIVITSINGITEAVKAFAKFPDWQVILIGDKKTPKMEKNPFPNVFFLSVEEQMKLNFSYFNLCPFNHYVRKNLGYLYAIQQGAAWIADTDDDNFPYENWAGDIIKDEPIESLSEIKTVNIYKYFTNQHIWPRGLPLNAILGGNQPKTNPARTHDIAVWQGLADKDPDVDAIYRLAINKPVIFEKRPPIALDFGTYCPFNSQNTIWTDKKCFPYLYIPSSVTFRFCDILRGYIAQRGLWAVKSKLAFHQASVYQERNIHDFMKDFIDEIPCYQQVEQVIDCLDAMDLKGDPAQDIAAIYKKLAEKNIVTQADVKGVQAFIDDLNQLLKV